MMLSQLGMCSQLGLPGLGFTAGLIGLGFHNKNYIYEYLQCKYSHCTILSVSEVSGMGGTLLIYYLRSYQYK